MPGTAWPGRVARSWGRSRWSLGAKVGLAWRRGSQGPCWLRVQWRAPEAEYQPRRWAGSAQSKMGDWRARASSAPRAWPRRGLQHGAGGQAALLCCLPCLLRREPLESFIATATNSGFRVGKEPISDKAHLGSPPASKSPTTWLPVPLSLEGSQQSAWLTGKTPQRTCPAGGEARPLFSSSRMPRFPKQPGSLEQEVSGHRGKQGTTDRQGVEGSTHLGQSRLPQNPSAARQARGARAITLTWTQVRRWQGRGVYGSAQSLGQERTLANVPGTAQ